MKTIVTKVVGVMDRRVQGHIRTFGNPDFPTYTLVREPDSAPTDAFLQIVNNLKAGRVAMAIHHISTANDMAATFGDAITAVPVPRGPGGTGWATYGDGSNCVFSASKYPEAAWKWISWLSEGPNNVAYNKLAGYSAGTINPSLAPAVTGTGTVPVRTMDRGSYFTGNVLYSYYLTLDAEVTAVDVLNQHSLSSCRLTAGLLWSMLTPSPPPASPLSAG